MVVDLLEMALDVLEMALDVLEFLLLELLEMHLLET